MEGPDDDSRAAAVGRKRRRPDGLYGDIDIERNNTSNLASKKQQVWPLPDRPFPNSRSNTDISSGGEANRRSSKESGEISSSVDSIHRLVAMSPPRHGFTPINVPSRDFYRNDLPSRPQSSSGSPEFPHETSRVDSYSNDNTSEASSDDSSDEKNPSDDISDDDDATSSGTRLEQLAWKDRVLQGEVFSITNLKALVRCQCCAQKGHTERLCPERTCEHCGARDAHASRMCPTWRKCTRCRRRGHDSVDCKSMSHPDPGGPDDPCDICGQADHIEQICPHLANIYYNDDNTKIKRIPETQMLKSCYECGRSTTAVNGHWGDDCPFRDPHRPYQTKGTWSREYMNRYIIRDTHAEIPIERNPPLRTTSSHLWHASIFEDGRD